MDGQSASYLKQVLWPAIPAHFYPTDNCIWGSKTISAPFNHGRMQMRTLSNKHLNTEVVEFLMVRMVSSCVVLKNISHTFVVCSYNWA